MIDQGVHNDGARSWSAMERNSAPQPCCGCASMYGCFGALHPCSANMLRVLRWHAVGALYYQAVWSPPLFTACVCDLCRVRVLVRLSHPRPPDHNQHGCTVGVLPGPTRVLPMPRQYGIGRRAPTRAVLRCGVWWCVVHVLVWIVSSSRFVLCPLEPLLDMVTAVALSILRGTSHHSWLIALADTTDLRL